MNQNLYGLILTGGKSTRMGKDKALLSYQGQSQVERTHDLLSQFCPKIFLSKRADQKSIPQIPSIDDLKEFSDIGPLGGICSAMTTYPDAAWLIMACDLPFVTKDTLTKLITHRDPHKFATAFISVHDQLPEPLCAIWENGGLNKILNFLQDNIKCPRKILIKSDTCLIQQDQPQWLDNVNSPEEYEKAVKLL